MTLNQAQLAELLRILDKIDRGVIQPRLGDRIGRFLRQYESGRRELRAVLAQHSVTCRSDGAVSGNLLGPIEIHSLVDPDVDALAFPLGEVASTLVISEQLGAILNIRMWLNAGTAQAAFSVLKEASALRLLGDYRWTPLGQLTPGEAQIQSGVSSLSWQSARCLKAVADDLLRTPHAVEYVLDYRLGPPSLKFFRTICATRANRVWTALPCFGEPRTFNVSAIATEDGIPAGDLLLLFMYREPWSNDWTVVRAISIEPADALAHALTWTHFRSELSSERFDPVAVTAAHESLRPWGVKTDDVGDLNFDQHLRPVPKTLLQRVRGID